jgi:hypothetical protein
MTYVTYLDGLFTFCSGPTHEWHLDLKKIVTLEKLGDCPACPDSREEPRSKCHSSDTPMQLGLAHDP